MSGRVATGNRRLRTIQIVIALLIVIVLGSFVKRLLIDVPNIAAGTLPPDDYDVRFVTEHWPAYLHIGPGVALAEQTEPQPG
jgi:hypothetical protein